MSDESGSGADVTRTAGTASRPLITHCSLLVTPLRAVLVKELRGRMRGWRALTVLTVYLLVLSGFTLLFYLAATGGRSVAVNSGPTVGKVVFFGVAGLQLGLVAFLAPAFSAGTISGEREKQTFDLLLTTPLPPWVLVSGKLVGALAYLLLLVVAGLPLLSLGYLLGGVAPDEVAVAMVLLLVTTLTYGAVGLWYSAHLRSTIGATVLAYATILVPLAGIPPAALLTVGLLSSLFSNNPPVWYIYGGLFILSLNPHAAGGLTAAWLGEGKGLWVIAQEFGQTKLLLLSPWLMLTITYLLLSIGLVIASIRRLRPASSRRAGTISPQRAHGGPLRT